MKLSLVMPVFNEERTVAKTVNKVFQQKQVTELVVVDDGSTDGTSEILSKLKKKFGQSSRSGGKKILVFRKKNGGKGSAVQLGLSKVSGDYVLIQDADAEYDPADIPALIKPVVDGRAEVVFGSRFLGPHSNLLFWHRVGNNFLNLLVNVLYNTTLSDMETCYKLVPTKLLRDIDICSTDFCMEPEITCKILKKKIHIYEVPISYVGRDFSEGKKITWQHGFTAMWTIIRLRFAEN